MTIALGAIFIGMLVCFVMVAHDVFTVRKMVRINNNLSIASLRILRRVGFTALVAAALTLVFSLWALYFFHYFENRFFSIVSLISAIFGLVLLHLSRVILHRTKASLTKTQQ